MLDDVSAINSICLIALSGAMVTNTVSRGIRPPGFLRLRDHFSNHYRPHGILAGQTPAGYLKARRATETPPSHVYWAWTSSLRLRGAHLEYARR
jgi:hypothetical protein